MKWLSAGVKVGVLFLLMTAGAYMIITGLGTDPAGRDNIELSAKFRDASGMPIGSKVVVAGLPVGVISSLSIEGRHARIRFRVRKDVPVWSNAVVFKKATSLLGDNYLEIDPGGEDAPDPAGGAAVRLGPGGEILRVVEATSPDQLLRRIEQSLPNVDAVLLSVRDLSEEMRRVVNGPIASVATRVDDLVQREADTVSGILAKADRAIGRIDQIAVDIRKITGDADGRVDQILANLEAASAEAQVLVTSARQEVEATGAKLREKLDQVDGVIASTDSIAKKIDGETGTLGKLVNDPAIADNVEEITDDAKGFLGTIFALQTYVGLRSEYNVFSGLLRHYISVELHTRPDKFYLIELERGPRGDYPDVTLEFDPRVDPDNWTRKTVIQDKVRFTFQFAKRFGWLTLRYGLKESTGGVGADVDLRWWNRNLHVSADVFDATFDQLPRVKLAASYEILRHVYILGGVDELLNNPDTLQINLGNDTVPTQFETFHFGRDYFAGAMVRFNDRDLAALLAIGGGALGAVGN